MTKKKKRRIGRNYEPIIHAAHHQSSALIFLSLAAVLAHKTVTLPKR